MFRQSVDSQTSVRGVPDIFSGFVYVPDLASDLANLGYEHAADLTTYGHARETAGKVVGIVKLRVDDHVAARIDIAPLATASYRRQSFRKTAGIIKLQLDYQLASLVDGAKFVVDDDSGHAL